ncbi:MAG: hypothetical protein ACTSQ8_01130, partial [Candidatus Helarchaeota archaeon]
EDLLKKIAEKIATISNAYKGFYLYDSSKDDYETIETKYAAICKVVESFLTETEQTLIEAQKKSLDQVMQTDVEVPIGTYIVDSNFFDFLYEIEKNDRPFTYLNEIIKYGVPLFITEPIIPTIKVPEELIYYLLKNIHIFKITEAEVAQIKQKITTSTELKDSSFSLIALAQNLNQDDRYRPVTIVTDDFKLIQIINDYFFKDIKIVPSSSFVLELTNKVKDKQIQKYFNKIRKKIINIEMQQALEQRDTHPGEQLTWLIEKAISAAGSSFTTTVPISDETSQIPKVELSLINLYLKGHKLQAPQLRRITDLIPHLDRIKDVTPNLNTIQRALARDDMENASKLIHRTLNILTNTFLLASADLHERRKLQFQTFLAKMLANFEFLGAICHTDLNQLEHAIDHFTQSAIYSTLSGNQNNIVISAYLKGLSFIHKGEYKAALRQFDVTRLLSEQYKVSRYAIMGLGGIAITRYLLGDIAEAQEIMDEVNHLIENDEQEGITVMNEFGDNFYMMGRPNIAIHLYNEAFQIALDLKRINTAYSIFSKIKRSYYALGSFDTGPITVKLQKILELAYELGNDDVIKQYQQTLAQLEKTRELIQEPLPIAIDKKWVTGVNLPKPLKGWMDLLHVAREQKQLDGKKAITFTNFFCYNHNIGNIAIQIPQEAPLRFERVPEAYQLSLKTNNEKYSLIKASKQEKEKYLLRIVIITKSIDNISIKRVTPQVYGKFLEI